MKSVAFCVMKAFLLHLPWWKMEGQGEQLAKHYMKPFFFNKGLNHVSKGATVMT
jgi:hypothetical protein